MRSARGMWYQVIVAVANRVAVLGGRRDGAHDRDDQIGADLRLNSHICFNDNFQYSLQGRLGFRFQGKVFWASFYSSAITFILNLYSNSVMTFSIS